jgi:hypothetical protein
MPDRVSAPDRPVAAVTGAPGLIRVIVESRMVEVAAGVQLGAGVRALREQLRNLSRLAGPPPETSVEL